MESHLIDVYTFSFPTPEYGIASKSSYNLGQNEKVRVASCEPVVSLLEILLRNKIEQNEYLYIITPSTTKALEAMVQDEADIAITNRACSHYENMTKPARIP